MKMILYISNTNKKFIFSLLTEYLTEIPLNKENFDEYFPVESKIFSQHLINPVMKWCSESSNLCVFSGGQTFSGKEDCLFGDRLENSLVFETLRSIFEYIEGEENKNFILRVWAFDIYNEEVFDLLAINSIKPQKNTTTENVIEEVWSSLHEIVSLWNLWLNNKLKLNLKWKKDNEKLLVLFTKFIFR